MKRIYFDYASTTPTDPAVIKAMEPYFFEQFGNPSSPHTLGREANKVLEESRERVAKFLGAAAEEIIFNSGGSEGNNHAVLGIAHALREKGQHIIVSAVEHHSLLEPAAFLRDQGCKITYLPVDAMGRVNPQDVKKAITPETILIAVMHASNEIGTIQPVEEIGRIAKESKIPFLVDAVQTVGHIPVNVNQLGADFLSLSAHKFYGPKGVGALYIRKGVKVNSFLRGGDQERGRRASTQNVAGIVGLAKALELCQSIPPDNSWRAPRIQLETEFQITLRNRLIEEIPKKIQGVKVNGHLTERLPNNAHFSFEKVEGEALLMSLDMQNIAASMGSACTSGAMEPSHVLRAIGLSDELALGSLRLSIGRWTTQEDIDYLLEKLPDIVASLRI